MAAVDYFLKIDGIEGEATAKGHEKEIEIESFSWGETNTGSHATGGGGGAGKVNMQDFHVTMKNNSASPKLLLACASGEHIKKAILTCRKAGKEQQEYLKLTMNDILVSSFQTSGSAGEMIPMDSFSLNFSKIEYEYKPQKPDGTLGSAVKAGWDLKTGTKV